MRKLGVVLILAEIDMEVYNLYAISFEATLLFFWPINSEVGRESTFTINDAKTGGIIWVRIMMKDISNGASKVRIAKMGGNLTISNDFTGGNRAEKGVDFFGERGRTGHSYSV